MDVKIKRTQYFNLLAWCWEQMSRDRDKPVMLIADEAHMMIDPNVPQSLSFLASTSKRARKYGSALAVATQNVCDFLDPSIKKFGQAVLSNSTYKIMMGMAGQDLKELSALYNLTEAEQEFLASQQRRQALMNIGAKRLKVKFEISDWRLKDYFGKAGGR
jgi:DNA helicase HerA-like ATPase